MMGNTQDTLMHRIAGNDATPDDIAAFEVMAQDNPEAWEKLARTLRDELQMRCELSAELDRGAASEINRAVASVDADASRRATERALRLRTWSGWAAAAALALAFVMIFAMPGADEVRAPNGHGVTFAALSADEAYDRYLDLGTQEGRLLMELPSMMVESRPTDDGRLEVTYLRQLLEREIVGSAYELQPDEHGLPTPVPVNLATFESFELPM